MRSLNPALPIGVCALAFAYTLHTHAANSSAAANPTSSGYLADRSFKADPNLENGAIERTSNNVLTEPSAHGAISNTQALQQTGARYLLVWLLPDLDNLSSLFTPTTQQPYTALSSVFNQQLINRLGRFDTAATAPTSLGRINELLADYRWSLLSAPAEISLLPEMASGTLHVQQDELRSQLLADWSSWQTVGRWRAIFAGGGQSIDADAQNMTSSAGGHTYNLTVGASYRLADHWRAGAVAGMYEQSLEAGPRNSEYQLGSYIATAFVQYQANHWWADLALSAGRLKYDNLKRKYALGAGESSKIGDTSGNLWALSTRLGVDLAPAVSRWHFSPFISADYSHINVSGYEENNDVAAALNFGNQTRRSKRLGFGLQGKFDITTQMQFFAELAQEREFETEQQSVTVELGSAPGTGFTLQGYEPQRDLSRVSLGISQRLTPDVNLSAGYSWRKNDSVMQQGLNLVVSLDF